MSKGKMETNTNCIPKHGKFKEQVRKQSQNVKQWLFFFVILVLALIAMGYGYEKVRTEYEHTVYAASGTKTMPYYEKDTYYRVDFALEKNCKIDDISLAYINLDPDNATGTMEIVVTLTKGDGTEETLATTQIAAEEIPSWGWISAAFDHTCEYQAGERITITSRALEDWRDDNGITSVCTEEGMLAVKVNADYWDIVQIVYVIFCVLLVALLVLCFLTFFVFHWKKELFYVLAISCGCLFFALLLPPFYGPDENVHFMQVYEVAERLQGVFDENANDSAITVVEAEMLDDFTKEEPAHDDYKNYYSNLLKKTDEVGWTTTPNDNYIENPDFLFTMPAVGTVLGRTLHLSGEGIFFFARLFNFIPILLCLVYAFKRVPFGKEIIFAICMMPITLQQMAVVNPDGIVLALSFAIFAGCMRLCEDTWDKWYILDAITVVVGSLVVSMCKYGCLVPICLLPIIVFAKQRKCENKLHRMFAWGGLAVTILSILCGFAPRLLNAFSSYGSTVWSDYYTFSDVLENPRKIFLVFLNSLQSWGDFYVLSLGGYYLGWQNIYIPETVAFSYLLLLLFFAIPTKSECNIFNGKDRAWLFLIGFLGIAFAFGGMLVGWTPRHFNIIAGVQGRYFLPFLLPLIYALRGKHICVAENGGVRSKLVLLMTFLLVLTVSCLFVRMQ